MFFTPSIWVVLYQQILKLSFVLSSASINSVMAQFQFQLFVLFIVLKTCYGALQCEDDACGRSTSRYTEPYESKTLSAIEEIPYMISPEDFYYKFVAKHRPLVLRRTATNWPANKVRWTILFMFCLDLLTHFALHQKIAISLGAICFYAKRKETFQVLGNHDQKFDGGGEKVHVQYYPIPGVLLMVNCKLSLHH